MSHKIEQVFTAPGPHPNGMQASAEGIWILDQHTNQVSLVAYKGEVLKTFDTESDRGSGITATSDALWIASTYNCKIIKANRASGKTLSEYPTAGAAKTGAHGLEWRGGKLWMAVPPSATIYQLDPERNCAVIHAIPAPGNRPHGIAWEGDDLWCVETTHRAIYRLNVKDGSIIDKIEIPEPYPEPHGMTRWEGNFWYCDAVSRAVCKVTP